MRQHNSNKSASEFTGVIQSIVNDLAQSKKVYLLPHALVSPGLCRIKPFELSDSQEYSKNVITFGWLNDLPWHKEVLPKKSRYFSLCEDETSVIVAPDRFVNMLARHYQENYTLDGEVSFNKICKNQTAGGLSVEQEVCYHACSLTAQ